MLASPASSAPTASVPVIDLQDVTRVYVMGEEEVRALDGINLQVDAGDYVAVMGASGSGKSTLLNVLGCLDRPTSGVYRLGGRDVSTLSDADLSRERNMRLGFVFQSYHLIPHLTVLENIEVPMEYAGVPPRVARRRARDLAERIGLGDRTGHRPMELSGGQQQRVGIARSLANAPLVLLADEPTGNLDSTTGQEILALLDELQRGGTTVVIVTHDAGVGARARRVVRMKDGRIESVEVNAAAAETAR